MPLWLERWGPLLVGGVVTCASLLLSQGEKADLAKDLANPVVSILAITAGLVAAIMTFLLTADSLEVLGRLRSTKLQDGKSAFDRLLGYHWSAIQVGFAACLFSLAVIATDRVPKLAGCFPILFHAWVLVACWAISAFARVVSLLRRMLS